MSRRDDVNGTDGSKRRSKQRVAERPEQEQRMETLISMNVNDAEISDEMPNRALQEIDSIYLR